jgi:hypothetical protein
MPYAPVAGRVAGQPHWVRATVDPRDEEVFSFEPELVEENVAP